MDIEKAASSSDTPPHAGKRVAHADGRIFNAAGELIIAYGSESCLISNRPRPDST